MADLKRIESSDSFKKELLPGETVLWRGNPGKFTLIGSTGGTALLTWIISIVVFVVVSAFFIWGELASGVGFIPAWQGVLAVIFLYFFCLPFFHAGALRRSAYFVTDQRVIMMVGGRTFRTLSKKGLRVKWDQRGDAWDVLFGSAVGVKEKKHFRYAWDPKRDENEEEVTGLIFFHIADDPALRALF